MTALATAVRAPLTVNRRLLAAGTLVAFGLVDVLLFGLSGHQGDATFALSLIGAKFVVPSIHAPATPVAYILGAASIVIGIARALVTESPVAGRTASRSTSWSCSRTRWLRRSRWYSARLQAAWASGLE